MEWARRCDRGVIPTLMTYKGSLITCSSLVFVHGLRGDPITTWSKEGQSKDQVCWPRDFLKLDFPDVRIVSWGYDSSVLKAAESASHASIFTHSENLLADISGLRRALGAAVRRFRQWRVSLMQAFIKSRPIIFVCHSLGGLVVKEV